MSDETGIQRARFAAGGEKGRDIDIARLLGISPAAVSRWNGVVPPKRAIEIEEKSGGRVQRHQIRPDHFVAPVVVLAEGQASGAPPQADSSPACGGSEATAAASADHR